MADPAVRAALDRDLLADAILQALKRRAAEAPAQALELADQAAAKLSDRPGIASAPQSGVLDAADVGSLRLAERLGQTDHGRGLLRSWLDYQRASRLSPTDAEGRLTAAQQQYEDLTGDRATAEVLLRKA